MPDLFNANVLQEAGEAIGGVGRRLFRRRKRARYAEETLRRWLDRIAVPEIPPASRGSRQAPDEVVETTWRVIDETAPDMQEDIVKGDES